MFEQGSHIIDPMVRLMGRPLKVTSTLKRHGPFERFTDGQYRRHSGVGECIGSDYKRYACNPVRGPIGR